MRSYDHLCPKGTWHEKEKGEPNHKSGLQLRACFFYIFREKPQKTRVRNIWLKLLEDLGRGVAAIYYFMHHMRVDRTLLLAREMNPHIPRKCGCKVIRECEQC